MNKNNSENESEIESKVVTVGSTQGYRALMVVALLLLLGGVYYFYFSSPSEESTEVIKKEETKQDIQDLKKKLEQVPDNVMVPERIITNPLPPLPPLLTPQVIPEVKPIQKEEEIKKGEEKPKESPVSNIPILPKNLPHSNLPTTFSPSLTSMGSSGYPRDRRGTQMLALSGGGDRKSRSKDAVLSDTAAQSSKATRAGKFGLMIAQGKIIDVILETAINSDLQGMLRAVVSRDVYAEAGDMVLIPRGSRLIGGYSFDSNIAKARVTINWNRVILPHGIDIAISSPGTDELGRAGVGGIVDNKVTSALFSSILLAGVSVGSAVLGQKASNLVDTLSAADTVKSITATEIDISPLKDIIGEEAKNIPSDKWKLGIGAINKIRHAKNDQELLKTVKEEIAKALGGTISADSIPITLEDINQLFRQVSKKSKSVYETAIEQSINDFSKDMRDIVNRQIDKKPTIYVDQGTALKVFVNQDIVFPLQAILNK